MSGGGMTDDNDAPDKGVDAAPVKGVDEAHDTGVGEVPGKGPGGAPGKGVGAWGQAIAAFALVGAVSLGLWAVSQNSSSSAGSGPAKCTGGEPDTSAASRKAPSRVSGAQLCEALNRRDLAELLGTPQESAKSASGSGGSFKVAGGKEVATPSAQVEFATYTVSLSATYDGLPVSGTAALLGGGAQQRQVLGRQAVLYSDHTISIRFRLDGKDSESGPGVPARALVIAQDAEDHGGSFEVTLWRDDGGVPDDAVLLRIAHKILPTIPGWAATT